MTSIPSFSSPSAYTTRPSVSDQQRTGVLTVGNQSLKKVDGALFLKAIYALIETIGPENTKAFLEHAERSPLDLVNLYTALGGEIHISLKRKNEESDLNVFASDVFKGPISSDPLTSLETQKRVPTLLAHVKKHTNTESNELDIPSLFKPINA